VTEGLPPLDTAETHEQNSATSKGLFQKPMGLVDFALFIDDDLTLKVSKSGNYKLPATEGLHEERPCLLPMLLASHSLPPNDNESQRVVNPRLISQRPFLLSIFPFHVSGVMLGFD
jgi:hypothetical protein